MIPATELGPTATTSPLPNPDVTRDFAKSVPITPSM